MGCWRRHRRRLRADGSARFRSRPRLPSASSSRARWQVAVLNRATSATPDPTRSSPPATFRCGSRRTATRWRSARASSAEWRPRCCPRRSSAPPPLNQARTFENLLLIDGDRELRLVGHAARPELEPSLSEWPLSNGTSGGAGRQRSADDHYARSAGSAASGPDVDCRGADHLAAGQPTVGAAPAAAGARGPRLSAGQSALDLPRKLGPAQEIQELRDAFARAITRVDESEREMTGALEGQRRLVREVHHRVKNNLQVIASLLNIHGRSAEAPEARSAYAGISRRVGALSIVHRNHFAEMEENRGIALRPLIVGAGGRASGRRAGRSARAQHRARHRDGLHHAGRRGRGRLPGHRNRRIRDAQCAARTQSNCRFAGPAN